MGPLAAAAGLWAHFKRELRVEVRQIREDGMRKRGERREKNAL
jgi:hypothetical protein